MAAEKPSDCIFFFCECGEDWLIIYPGLVHRSWLGSGANVVGAVGKSLDHEAHVRHRYQDILFFFLTLDVDRETRTAWPSFFFMAVITGSLQSGGFLPSGLKRHFPRLLKGSWSIGRCDCRRKKKKKKKSAAGI